MKDTDTNEFSLEELDQLFAPVTESAAEGEDDAIEFDDPELFKFEDDDKKGDCDDKGDGDDDEDDDDEDDDDDDEVEESAQAEILGFMIDSGIATMEEVQNAYPHLEAKVIKIKQTRQGRINALRKQTALNMAKAAGDANYKKYRKFKDLALKARDAIYAKYDSRAGKAAKKMLMNLKKGPVKLRD